MFQSRNGVKAVCPYKNVQARNGRNSNSFSLGLINAWEAGLDCGLTDIEHEIAEKVASPLNFDDLHAYYDRAHREDDE